LPDTLDPLGKKVCVSAHIEPKEAEKFIQWEEKTRTFSMRSGVKNNFRGGIRITVDMEPCAKPGRGTGGIRTSIADF
jgi:hypothetical protein